MRGAFLVAPPSEETLATLDGGLWPAAPRARLPWPAVLVASRTDPWCSHRQSLALASDWGADFVDAGEAGRIDAEFRPRAVAGRAAEARRLPEEAGVIRDLTRLLAEASPRLHPDAVAVVGLEGFAMPPALPDEAVIATFREAEGLTLYVDLAAAEAAGLPVAFRAAWITMSVQSALDAVGFTAAFASALARAGIACNVMAGARHDHLFVPWEQAEAAMAALRGL